MERGTQPSHLKSQDALQAIQQGYDEAMLEALRQKEGKELAFGYNHSKHAQDRDAMQKYKEVAKRLNDINATGLWNHTTLLQAIGMWDKKLGRLLSMHMGEKAIKMAASNLLQIMQDFRNVKRNQKTGARTPHWIVEVIQNLKLDPSTIETSRCEGSGIDPIEASRGQTPSLRMAGPIEDSRGQPPGEHSGKKRRVLSFQLSTTSDEPQPSQKKVMLALCDEEGNNKYLYEWDEVANKGAGCEAASPTRKKAWSETGGEQRSGLDQQADVRCR